MTMIIDRILDRRDGGKYDAEEVCEYIHDEAKIFGYDALAKAAFNGTSEDMRRELCAYIDIEGYAPEIKDYINSVEW